MAGVGLGHWEPEPELSPAVHQNRWLDVLAHTEKLPERMGGIVQSTIMMSYRSYKSYRMYRSWKSARSCRSLLTSLPEWVVTATVSSRGTGA